MKWFNRSLPGLRRLFPWRRPSGDPASRLSDAIERETTDPRSGEDPALAAIIGAAGPRPLPEGLAQRSWQTLERELFASPAVQPAITVPFHRVPRTAFVRTPRTALVATAATATVLAVGLWQGPAFLAQSLIKDAVGRWETVQSFDADVQFASFVPGKQMQWSGRQLYGGPDRILLQATMMGISTRMVVNGDAGAVDLTETGARSDTGSRFRFMAALLRPAELISLLERAPESRYLGGGEVLGRPCRMVSFTLPGREAGPGSLVESVLPEVHRGVVWLSPSQPVPLQTELYRADGSVAAAIRYLHLEPNVPMPPAAFEIPGRRRLSETGSPLRQKVLRVWTVGFRLPDSASH